MQRQIDTLNWQLIESTLEEQGKHPEIEKIKLFRKSNINPFFLWRLHFAEVFEEKGGFDIVIGNPPYVGEKGNKNIFDGFDSTQDSTLQSSKTMCHGWVLPTFEMADDFIPQLDDKQFPLLLSEAKSLAFFELKQQPHQKAEQEIKRQISSLQKYKSESSKPTDFDQLPNYGRRGSGWL